MKRLVCLLLCAVMFAQLFPIANAAKKDEELLEVTVTTHSNIAESSNFDIDGLYADNVFYINADHIAVLTGATVIEDNSEMVALSLHEETRYIEIYRNQTLQEFDFGQYEHDIPVVTYMGRLWVCAPDILRYMGAKVAFGADETANVHMIVSMPFTVLDLYWKYVDAKGYLFDWSEADGRIFDPDEQLGISALSTVLFEYDASVVGFVIPAYQDYLHQSVSQEAILSIMRNDTTALLDPYYEGYEMFGEISGSMDLTVDALEELCGVLSDDVCADYFQKSTQSMLKGAGTSLSAAGTVVEVAGDYLTAMETAQQFHDMSRANKELFANTLMRAAKNTQMYEQNPNFYEAVYTADSLISGSYSAKEYAQKKAVYSLLTEAVNTGITSLHPAIAAADFAMGIMENLPVLEGYFEDDVRIAYADQCRFSAQVAHTLLAQDFRLNQDSGSHTYWERMRYDMILSLKSSITARTLLYEMNYWLKDEARTNMKAKAKQAAKLLALAYQAEPNTIGKMDRRNEDLTWIAKLAGVGGCGQVVSVGGKTYYWKYDRSSYADSEIHHTDAQNTLVCMDEKGKTSTVGVFNAYGAFAVTGQWIIVNKWGGGILLQKHDGSETRSMGYRMQWVSPNGKYMIYTEQDGSLYAVSLTTFEKERLLGSGTFVTAHNGVAYISTGDPGAIRLYSWKPGDDMIRDLYQFSGKEDDWQDYAYPYIAQMRFTEEYIYFCFGTSGGSGSFFQGGKIVRIRYDGSDARMVAGGDELVDWYFTVNEDGAVQTQPLQGTIFFTPMEQFVVEDGTLYQINSQTGLTFPILSKKDYKFLGSEPLEQVVDDTIITLEFAQVVDGKVYCILHRCRVEEGLGWRLRYIPEKTVMLMRDMGSGKVTVLYTVE